jgi:hypothetical protein
MTDTELKVMAALAIMGLSRIPSTGLSTPVVSKYWTHCKISRLGQSLLRFAARFTNC